eukprot:2928950-Rhodomonas_salina.2
MRTRWRRRRGRSRRGGALEGAAGGVASNASALSDATAPPLVFPRTPLSSLHLHAIYRICVAALITLEERT